MIAEKAAALQSGAQSFAEEHDLFAQRVVKKEWPILGSAPMRYDGLKEHPGMRIREYHLVHTALESQRFDPAKPEEVSAASDCLQHCLYQVWSKAFRSDVARLSENRLVVRKFDPASLPNGSRNGGKVEWVDDYQFQIRVNFFGRQVAPGRSTGQRVVHSKAYNRAAEQVIGFHPDIVHFLFLDPVKWVGEVTYRDSFFRVVCTYAAKPVHTEFGYVVTVTPPGLRGWLWYWAWRIVGFVP